MIKNKKENKSKHSKVLKPSEQQQQGKQRKSKPIKDISKRAFQNKKIKMNLMKLTQQKKHMIEKI